MDSERERKAATLWKAYGCLASGLAFIHKQTIRHKDIKPQNILIHQGNVLFTDFGISVDFSEHGRSTTTGHPQSFTRKYCAPEVANWDKRNSKSDVFSLGCVYAEILDALQPNLLPDALFKGPFHTTLDHLSPREISLDVPKKQAYHHILKLIGGMLALSIEERMSALDVIAFLPVSLDEMELFCVSCVPDREIGRRYWGSLNNDLNIEGAGEGPDPEINMKGPDFGGYEDNIEEQDHPTKASHSARSRLRVLYDQEDGVRRCPMCAWELEDGACTQCGLFFDDNGGLAWGDSFAGFSDADEASERDMSGEDLNAKSGYGGNTEGWQDYPEDEISFTMRRFLEHGIPPHYARRRPLIHSEAGSKRSYSQSVSDIYDDEMDTVEEEDEGRSEDEYEGEDEDEDEVDEDSSMNDFIDDDAKSGTEQDFDEDIRARLASQGWMLQHEGPDNEIEEDDKSSDGRRTTVGYNAPIRPPSRGPIRPPSRSPRRRSSVLSTPAVNYGGGEVEDDSDDPRSENGGVLPRMRRQKYDPRVSWMFANHWRALQESQRAGQPTNLQLHSSGGNQPSAAQAFSPFTSPANSSNLVSTAREPMLPPRQAIVSQVPPNSSGIGNSIGAERVPLSMAPEPRSASSTVLPRNASKNQQDPAQQFVGPISDAPNIGNPGTLAPPLHLSINAGSQEQAAAATDIINQSLDRMTGQAPWSVGRQSSTGDISVRPGFSTSNIGLNTQRYTSPSLHGNPWAAFIEQPDKHAPEDKPTATLRTANSRIDSRHQPPRRRPRAAADIGVANQPTPNPPQFTSDERDLLARELINKRMRALGVADRVSTNPFTPGFRRQSPSHVTPVKGTSSQHAKSNLNKSGNPSSSSTLPQTSSYSPFSVDDR